MTNEKIYSVLANMIRAYGDRDSSADIAEIVIANPHKYASANGGQIPFYCEAAALLLECMEGMDKKTTARGQLAAIKRFLSDNPARPIYQSALWTGEKLVCIDGYKMIILDRDIPSLSHVKECDRENFLNYEKCISGYREYAMKNGQTIPAPSLSELKAFKAANGGSKCVMPYVWADCVGVNPQYLIDAIQAAPGAVFYKPQSPMSAIYFKFDGGEGMILPVKLSAETMARVNANYETEKQREKREQMEQNAATLEEMARELENENRKARAAEIIREYLRGEYSSRTAGRYMNELLEAERDEKARAAYVEETRETLETEAAEMEIDAADIINSFVGGWITAEEARQLMKTKQAESQERSADTAQDNRQTERPETVNNGGNVNRADSQNADRGQQAIHAETGPECAGIAAAVILSPLAVSTMAGTIKEPRPDTS